MTRRGTASSCPGRRATPGMTAMTRPSSPSPATSTCRPAATPTTGACWRCCRPRGVEVRHLDAAGLLSRADRGRPRRDRAPARRVARRRRPPDRRARLWRDAGRSHRRVRAPIVALVHHPLCLEAGLAHARQRRAARAGEGGARAGARVSSSPARRRAHADRGLRGAGEQDHGRRAGHRPGAARAGRTGAPLQLLAVGSIVPRKAYDVLVRALAPLSDRDWRLTHCRRDRPQRRALAALASGRSRESGPRAIASSLSAR